MKSDVIDNLSQLYDEKHYAQLYLPPYQRPYCWEKENWQSLLEDFLRTVPEFDRLTEQKERITHFLGIIVVLPVMREAIQVDSGSVGNRINYRQGMLVDGQQRCISLILLAKVIQVLLHSSMEVYKREVTETETDLLVDASMAYITLTEFLENQKKGVKGSAKHRITPGKTDKEAFDVCMSGLHALGTSAKKSEILRYEMQKRLKKHSMVKAYEFFQEELKQFVTAWTPVSTSEIGTSIQDQLLAHTCIANALLQNLKLVIVELDTADIGSATFADINSKGKPLNEMDLIKNMLHMSIYSDKNQVSDIEKQTMIEFIEAISERSKEFQRDFYALCAWVFTGQTAVAKNRIYPEILNKFDMDFRLYFDVFQKLWRWYDQNHVYACSSMMGRIDLLAKEITQGRFISFTPVATEIAVRMYQWIHAWSTHKGQERAANRVMLRVIHELLFMHDANADKFALSDKTVELLQKKEARTTWEIECNHSADIITTLTLMYPEHQTWGPLIPLRGEVYEGMQRWIEWGISLKKSFSGLTHTAGNWVYISEDIYHAWRQDEFELVDKRSQIDLKQLPLTDTSFFTPVNIDQVIKSMNAQHSRRFREQLLELLESA